MSALHVTPIEREILRACIHPNYLSQGLVGRIDEGVCDDTLPFGAMRLLPFLLAVAPKLTISDEARGVIRSVQHHTHARNLVTLSCLERATEALASAGIQVLTLKGAALLQLAYASLNVRPAADGDLLIISDHSLADCAPGLEAAGLHWVETSETTSKWKGPAGAEIDLHEYLKPQIQSLAVREAFAEGFFQCQGPVARLNVPAPEALMFHVMLHGGLYSTEDSHARWLLDAVVLARAYPALDWSRVQTLAQWHGWTGPIQAAVAVLFDYLESPKPKSIEDHPHDRVPLVLRWSRAVATGSVAGLPHWLRRVLGILMHRTLNYGWRRFFPDWRGESTKIGFFKGYWRYLQEIFQSERVWVVALRWVVPARFVPWR